MNVELIETPAEPATEQANTLPAAPEARAALALNSTRTAADLRALVFKHQPLKGIEVKDKATREQIHGAAMELRTARTTIEKTAKAARDDATKFSKAVIAAEKELVAITEPLEEALIAQRDAWDTAEAKRKEAEAAAERARILAITDRITGLRNLLTLASQCRTSDRIQGLFDRLNAEEITADVYQEFEAEAAQAKAETLVKIKDILTSKQAEEAERRAEQERIEAQRLAAAEAQRLADEAAARVAAQQAELERQQRELAEQQAAFKREQEKAAADAQAAAEAAVAAQNAAAAVAAEAAELAAWPDADGVLPSPMLAAEALIVPAEVADEAQALIDAMSSGSTGQAMEFSTPDVIGYINPPSQPAARVRPADVVIVGALALHFRISHQTAIEWLQDMDMAALQAPATAYAG